MKIALSGAMASGKSTVAGATAARLGAALVDVDAIVEQQSGRSVAQLFAERGEAAFRVLEREATVRALEAPGDAVLALGGGAVVDRATRRALLERATLITLRAPAAELARRAAADGPSRPILAGSGDPAVALEAILQARADAYAECHAAIETQGQTPEEIAAEVIRVAEERPVVVPLGTRTYRVEIGAGRRGRLATRVRESVRGDAAVLVTDRHVETPWGDEAGRALADAGLRVARVVLEPGEEHKQLGSVEQIWTAALDLAVDRDAIVVAVGGGMVGDLAGFAASTLLRGIALAQVPTTIVAMADSAVGGKTGFDRPQGKNLIGTFHQPRLVLCDPEVLRTLPERERRAGLAEVVKSAWIAGEAEVAALERDAAALGRGELDALERAVRMAVSLKARIVAADEREDGARALLNLGHTLGHAIEAAAGYRGIRHGEAVSIGMVAAARVGVALGLGAREGEARLVELLRALDLPVDPDAHLDPRTLSFIGSDKKQRQGRVRYVVPIRPGDVRIVPLGAAELGEALGAGKGRT